MDNVPTWSALFGSPDTKEADAGRTVTSPAAYLADLLQLLEDRFEGADFHQRRPDISAEVPLNGEQSFSPKRQLDITNRVLADRIATLTGADADAVLAGARHPFLLPFQYQHERIRQLLLLLRTPHRDLHAAFAPRVDVDVLAREVLGLSEARAEAVVTDLSGDAAGLAAAYGLGPDEPLSSLVDLERFRRATGLDAPSLRELLFARLSAAPGPDGGAPERDAAGQLFIHHDLGGFVALDPGERQLVWRGAGDGIPAAWFDRVHRLLCLSRWTGIELTALDLFARQLPQPTLDASALRRLAVLVDLRTRTGATLEVLCGLFFEIDGRAALGAGDDPKQPASLFDRVFNAEAARLAMRYVPSGSDHLPEAYTAWRPLAVTGDLLADDGDNKALRVRIQTALGLSALDLAAIVTRFRDRARTHGRATRFASVDRRSLSTLHRVARLAELIDVPPMELLRVVDVLERDPSLKASNAFDVLQHEDISQADLYDVLEHGPLEARSWLIQTLIAVGVWASGASLAPEDLDAAARLPDETTAARQTELIAARALHEAFLPVALSAESLESTQISTRAARVALTVVRDPARRLVAPLDSRLVTFEPRAAREAAHAALRALDVVSVDDLTALSLGEEVATCLQSMLVRREVLDANGRLREDRFPARAEGLVLEPDAPASFNRIVDFLQQAFVAARAEMLAPAEAPPADDGDDLDEPALAADGTDVAEQATLAAQDVDREQQPEAEEALEADAAIGEDPAVEEDVAIDDGADAEIELALYRSDLVDLGFPVAEADEWIERLIALRVLDASGTILNPSLFGDPARRDEVPASLGLDAFRADIHAALAARRDRWRDAHVTLPDDIWNSLPLTVAERAALEQNLVFNGHIDSARRIVDRDALRALTPETFDLTLPFHRHRRAILEALQEVVAAQRDRDLTVQPDDLRPLADRIVATGACQALSRTALDARGRLRSDVLEAIDRTQPPFDLGASYSSVQQQRIWDLLRQVETEASQFRLTDAALSSVGIVGQYATDVIVALCAADCLCADRTLSPEHVARYVVANNVQAFTLPSYADYARDVFFLIHDVAVAVDAAVTALVTSLAAVADAQAGAVLATIGSLVELSPEATAAILRPLLRDAAQMTVALVGPVLAAAGPRGVVEQPPRDWTFRATLRRTRAFASFARKLGMRAREIEVVFQDQQLADKFPEAIELPPGADGIDALWTAPDGRLHLFRGPQYWTFDANTLARTTAPSSANGPVVAEPARPLSTLSTDFGDLPGVDAVYTLPSGEHWLLAQGRAWRRAADSGRWVQTVRPWGRVQSRFDDPAHIDCALHDHEGRVHLFSDDQYVRYSATPQTFVDEGYPKKIAPHWAEELDFRLPAAWSDGIDAAVRRRDEVTWLFRGDRYIASNEPAVERAIVDAWGHLRHLLASASRVDAVIDVDGRCGIVMGDQVSVFSSSLESEGLTADEGFPRTLSAVFRGLPEAFAHGVDAGITDGDGTIHLFRDQNCATAEGEAWQVQPTRERWGRVRNTLQETGRVDAALAGLDGRIYLFSGDQYVRYSGADLSRVDEGYPRTTSRDWGGITAVDAAVVLDGKTYLFGTGQPASSTPAGVSAAAGAPIRAYVRYSTRDYTKPDEGYPKPTDDNWWNLPIALVERGFNLPDAVFVAPDGRIHLFSGDQTVSFDRNHRWWSEPASIRDAWSSLPFAMVSAAFTGRDGRSYLFSSEGVPLFVRYTDDTFQRIDDRFPKPVTEHWGRAVSNLERTGRVDAAVSLVSTVTETAADGAVTTRKQSYRYLFSGDQFYRYSSDGQTLVDEGYPRRIQGNLRQEPHFARLDAPAERGIDGVWADSGNVFVFISDRMYVASTAQSRQLDGVGVERPRAADVEEGRLTVCGIDGWRHVLPPEAHARAAEPAMPRVLRTAPPAFQGRLSAILRGLDRNVYLFGGDQCYDRSLDRHYPIGAAWGRVRNHIAEHQRVDSALMGRDGKLYLFGGEEFVSYTPTAEAPTTAPDVTDTTPAPVAPRWGGLTNVRHAFVRKGVTYLLEAAAADGTFRYVRYFGADYSRPGDPAPLAGDFSFWKIPADFVARGFDRVDAAVAEGDDLILIRDDRFLHYEAATDTWTHPRALSLRWPDLPRGNPDFAGIRALVRGPDGRTVFFSERAWLTHDGERSSPVEPIASRWARVRNRITQANRVDATLVHEDHTFLFSGDEYVRYTGNQYQYIDAGYPRAIAGFLRQEAAFQALPADAEAAFEHLKPEDVWVETAFCSGGVVCVCMAGRTYALSARLSRTYPIQQVTRVRNELHRRARVDAAFARRDGALLLLSGDQYVRYSGLDLSVVDDGYPRAIGPSLLRELSDDPTALPPALPPAFEHDLDAALLEPGGALVLFKDTQFVRVDPHTRGGVAEPMPIKGVWGRVSNPFVATPDHPQPRIDAAFVAPDQALYVFRGDQYLRYQNPSAERVDEGYPRAIRDRWGDLPSAFEAGIDGGFVFGARTYLAREQRYVRYSDASYRRMDPIYPQPFADRWRASNDFLLRDLRTIERYVALDRSRPAADGSLTDFLLATADEIADPYAWLAMRFDWEIGDVQWLKRRDAFLDRPSREAVDEVRFDIELVLRIHDTLELARRLGSHPQELFEQVWSRLHGDSVQQGLAADTLHRLLGTLHAGENWTRLERQLGDSLSRVRRDAYVAWLVAHSPEPLADARDLSDVLLTDVEVDAIVDASRIGEAIAAVQLYFHRYLMNLEPAAAAGDDATRRPAFKEQWRWLRNYRVWEANRKVFLYPESYIRPELRDTRTAAFRALQDNLHQGEITEASVTQAYKKYLDEYTEVSRLIIAGGYVQPDPRDPSDSELTLFGATRTEPRRYYYRTATFPDDASSAAVWRAWRALGIEIRSARVYPVRAFGRTFVFWTEIEQLPPEPKTSMSLRTQTTDGVQQVSGEERVEYRLRILYSFCDLSEQWTSPQTLDFGPNEISIGNPRLRVSCVKGNDGQESILVNFTYELSVEETLRVFNLALLAALQRQDLAAFGNLQIGLFERLMQLGKRSGARRLTADLTVSGAEVVEVSDRRGDVFSALFDADEARGLNLDGVVVLGSAGGRVGAPWYSFDLKGGSFLARPVATTRLDEAEGQLRPLADNTDGLPVWTRVDAGLDAADGRRLLFDNQRMVYAELGDLTEHPIDERWGLRRTTVHADGQVDAAWRRKGVRFLLRGDRYVKYSNGVEWADDEGERGAVTDREADGVPPWTVIDAAFTDVNRTTWFFHGSTFAGLDADNRFSQEAEIRTSWGRERSPFVPTAPGAPAVVAAFTRNGRSFVIGSRVYTVYADSELVVAQPPQPQSLRALLVELNCRNAAEIDEGLTIVGVVDAGAELVFRVGRADAEEVYSLRGDRATRVKRSTKGSRGPGVAGFVHANRKFVLRPGDAGVVLTVGNGEAQRAYARDLRAAMIGLDAALYLFDVDSFVRVAANAISLQAIDDTIEAWPSRATPIADRWGRQPNVFTQRGTVDAALVRGEHTFLVSGDVYVRYSGPEYRFIDAAYPRALAGNPDGLPQSPFDAAIEIDGRICYFVQDRHAFSTDLQRFIPNRSRWGRIRTNILTGGVDAAYRIDGRHYLFSGSELACYTAGPDGQLPAYMDGAPARAELGWFRAVRAAFTFRKALYLIGPDRFVCCDVDAPERILPGYPRTGKAQALIADLRRRFALPAGSDRLVEGLEIFALSLQGTALLFDTDESGPGQRVLRFDLTTGQLSREWRPSGIDWAALRGAGSTVVELPRLRYSFRADQVMTTDRGQAAPWDSQHPVRSIVSVWGGRAFDAAITHPGDPNVYLFTDDRYASLPRAEATDEVGGAVVIRNVQAALSRSRHIRGGLSSLPADLMGGFDAALEHDGVQYFFKGPAVLRMPAGAVRDEVTAFQYELVRLTTSTAAELNRALFVGGAPRLLSLRMQEVDETPGFSVSISTPTTIRVNAALINEDALPPTGHLDFGSANGIYLWEIFFHAPFLIAEMLSAAQRFDEARTWFEHIFDPTERTAAWKFLPFLTVDVEQIVFEIRDRLERLEAGVESVTALRAALEPSTVSLLAMDPAFQGERGLDPNTEVPALDAMKGLPDTLRTSMATLVRREDGPISLAEIQALGDDLRELVGMVAELPSRWDDMQQSRQAQIETYLEDPFDPHAIAALRPIAYRKAVVMRYLDNVLNWGDMLFSQYTRESINEARMLYVHAWDLLGRRPESLGRKLLPAASAYDGLRDARAGEYDLLLQLADSRRADVELSFAASLPATPNESLAQPYFFIAPNEELGQYWTRVADRLHKIRHSETILGVRQSLALFEPPLDPMALVRAVAGGASLAGLADAAASVDVPHYRFTFLVARAQALAQKAASLGAELLAALEKRDAEELSELQTRHEGIILALTKDVRVAQIEEARANRRSLEASRESAQLRRDTYTQWIDGGLSPLEQTQINLMIAAAVCNGVAFIGNLAAAILSAIPEGHIGLFTFGADTPDIGDVVGKGAEGVQSLGEALQVSGEIAGILAQNERSTQDWRMQRELATLDLKQLDAQLKGADWQIAAAEQEQAIADRQVRHNEEIAGFYRRKFTSRELYDWMVGRLSEMHYQTYALALDLARAAERAFQFERGSSQAATSFVRGQQWDGQRRGLLAGAMLGLDLDRMESAFIANDQRRFEITKHISLLEIDPLAFLKLRTEGGCELDLGEALFDDDFPGHYCRQIKTLAMELALGEGVAVNATLTQLTSRVIMEPDPKAVAWLLEPKEAPPASIRHNWKAMQQVALSHHGENEPNNGLFELRFDSERYLPFEGTGAVSRWRLELGGRPGSYDLRQLTGVRITLKYTALQGGDAFAAAVRGLRKPVDALRAFSLNDDYAEIWQAFLEGEARVLELPVHPDQFPNMASGRIRAIFTRYDTDVPGAASFVLDLGEPAPLPDGKTVDTSGLTIRAAGTTLRLEVKGDKALLRNAHLVLGYKEGAR